MIRWSPKADKLCQPLKSKNWTKLKALCWGISIILIIKRNSSKISWINSNLIIMYSNSISLMMIQKWLRSLTLSLLKKMMIRAKMEMLSFKVKIKMSFLFNNKIRSTLAILSNQRLRLTLWNKRWVIRLIKKTS